MSTEEVTLEDRQAEIMDAKVAAESISLDIANIGSGVIEELELEGVFKMANGLVEHFDSAESCETDVDFELNLAHARKAIPTLDAALKAALKSVKRKNEDAYERLYDAQQSLRHLVRELADIE